MSQEIQSGILVARCHEIQTALGNKTVPEFDQLSLMGMSVKVALHIRGLPLIDYETLKLVCANFLDIPPFALDRIIHILGEVEFVYPSIEGKTIRSVLPSVPYYDGLYTGLGEYLRTETSLSEAEQLALTITDRLAAAPDNVDRLRNQLGADSELFKRNIYIGEQGKFLYVRRHRGRDIALNPVYFSENAEIFADHVAGSGADQVAGVLKTLRMSQGWPLSLMQRTLEIGGISISQDQIRLMERLAQDGVVKPPTITTPHAGENQFLFTPTPFAANISPFKRDVYEKAMAIVAAIRQGQLLPAKYAIRQPRAVLYRLKTELKLSRATTEFSTQYQNLVHLRVGQLVSVGNGYHEFRIVDTPDNREALDIAYDLVSSGEVTGIEVDEEARRALQSEHKYVESLVASARLRERAVISLPDDQAFELETLMLRGIS